MGYLGFSGTLLSRRDWVYLLSLLIPLTVYNLALKAYSVASLPGSNRADSVLGLMWSDLFSNLGYALLWIGLFAAVRGRGAFRWVVIILLHATTIFVLVVTTCAHQYFRQNGTTLDYGTIAEWTTKFDEIAPIVGRSVVATKKLASRARRRGWRRPCGSQSPAAPAFAAATIGYQGYRPPPVG
jgi:lipoteichoic acid synthase